MNRAERIFHLHRLLQARRPPSLADLMERLEVSRATIKRDLEYMRDFMQAPIEYDPQANGYRYGQDAPAFELPGLWFNESELLALLTMEQLLEDVQPGLLAPTLGPLKGRIRELLASGGHQPDAVRRRIRIRPLAQRVGRSEGFQAVAAATLDEQPIAIEYHGRARDTATRRVVHPQRLLYYRDNWYLIAWCEQAQDLRTFALERIRSSAPAEGTYRDIDESTLDAHTGAAFGIFTGPAQGWAVLRFTPEHARWVADETWHPDQTGHFEGEHYHLRVPFGDPTELIQEILRHGAGVEVLAPETLRARVAATLHEAAAQYPASS
ncbi:MULTISPECIES: YafY family protein [unclassified Thioalkalivibrio]|uniref:helix-turn-helix transcriptional regulator n=1 Tax=unclassified Thioalkalivibrio TaxID=2621013 RepID=UPI0003636183|nr:MULTISPECIES: YafY family protein [unclassified Thioalkalivibrio]